MPKPSSDWLSDDVGYLKSLGITQIVSLLESSEARSLALDAEKDVCKVLGVTFEQHPIKDRSTPSKAAIRDIVSATLNDILRGEHVAVHCRGGIGRAGLVCCCILIEYGATPDTAIKLVSKARRCPVPDTAEQLRLIQDYPDTM